MPQPRGLSDALGRESIFGSWRFRPRLSVIGGMKFPVCILAERCNSTEGCKAWNRRIPWREPFPCYGRVKHYRKSGRGVCAISQVATALIDAFEGLRDNLEISDSAFGRFHSTSFAPWQLTAEVAFEKRDVTADGARRNVQFTRGLGYASIPCCRLECAGSALSDGR